MKSSWSKPKKKKINTVFSKFQDPILSTSQKICPPIWKPWAPRWCTKENSLKHPLFWKKTTEVQSISTRINPKRLLKYPNKKISERQKNFKMRQNRKPNLRNRTQQKWILLRTFLQYWWGQSLVSEVRRTLRIQRTWARMNPNNRQSITRYWTQNW